MQGASGHVFTLGLLEVCWSEVASKDRQLDSNEQRHHKARALNRADFLQAIIRLAMRKCLPRSSLGTMRGDVAKSIELLIRTDILPRLPAEATQSSDAFRRVRVTRSYHIVSTSASLMPRPRVHLLICLCLCLCLYRCRCRYRCCC